MKERLNRIHFEYVLLGFIVPASLLMLEYPVFLSILPFSAVAMLFAWKINPTKGIFCTVALLMLFIFNAPFCRRQENELKNVLGGRPVYGKIKFEITDPLCCSLPDIRNGATVQIKIISIETAAGEKFHGDGKYLLFADKILPPTAAYGDIFEIRGTVRFSEPQTAWNSADAIPDYEFRFGNFQQYMQMRNIAGIIYPDTDHSISKKAENITVARKLLLFRDKTLAYVTEGLANENANLTGALFFGLKGALDKESKQQFIKSGTIHLFSVSGLHVGILFALLLPLTFFLPVSKRYILATVLLIPFILSTGANVPALRAFLMILVYSLLRCFCFHIPPLRILAGGCAAFLICNTAYLTDAGFLYSFGITGILLLCSEKITLWNRIWNTDRTFEAAEHSKTYTFKKFLPSRKKAIFALCSTLAAFAGGSIITLSVFGYLYFSTVWVNFFILFYSILLIWLFILKIIFAPISLLNGLFAPLFNDSLTLMQNVISFGAEHPLQLNTVQIPIYASMLFYFALLMLGTVRHKIVFSSALAFILAFFPCAIIASKFQKPQILLLRNPSNNQTAFVLADSRANYSWVYNIQDAASMEIVRKFLSSKGISYINIWIQHGSSNGKINALRIAAKNLKIGKVVHISRTPLDAAGIIHHDTIYDFKRQSGTKINIDEKISRFFRKKNQFGFEYFNTEAIIPLYVVSDSETQILIFRKNGKEHIREWTNSNLPEYFIYDI